MVNTPSESIPCIICLEDLDGDELKQALTCGFCDKRICRSCSACMTEIDDEGEADYLNGDLRCPNCRGSLVEGALHKRRQAIAQSYPNTDAAFARDLVTLEDLITRVVQLTHQEEIGVQYYNATNAEVVQAIARDREYSAVLARTINNPRHVRHLLHSLRRSPSDKGTATALCKEYVRLLTNAPLSLNKDHARAILGEVAHQSLANDFDFDRYLKVWQNAQPEKLAGEQEQQVHEDGTGATGTARGGGDSILQPTKRTARAKRRRV